MTVTHDLSLVSLLANASVLVQAVMVLLLLMSIISWWFMFRKMFTLRLFKEQTLEFETFLKNSDGAMIIQRLNKDNPRSGSVENIVRSGFKEWRSHKSKGDTPEVLEGIQRTMRSQYQMDMDALELHLSFLATVGSVSPYIGLFGTVWGIMNSFRGLAVAGQATLTQVAPGIAEALVATAMGLFAAIPAVMAYNFYTREIEKLSIRCERSIDHFTNILQRTLIY